MRAILHMGATAAAIVTLVLAVEATMTLAAGTTGSIYGTVTDQSGARLADVSVSAAAPSYTAKTVTNANGFYSLLGLPPDTYALTFSRQGYAIETRAGVTVTQDQSQNMSVALTKQPRTIGQVTVRGAASLMQPTQTSSTYTVVPKQIDALVGVPQQIFEGAVLTSLPGVFTDNAGGIIIRGGETNEVGYQLDGVENTEPVTGQFINSLALNGVARLVVSTGGYDVANGNTNAGIVNVVAKRGSYPGFGDVTVALNSPNFQHTFGFDYGSATPDNHFSYYFSFRGIRQSLIYGDGSTFPVLYGATQITSGNDDLFNFYYHFGNNNANEIQYFADIGSNLFNANWGLDFNVTPYASNNNADRIVTGLGSGLFPFAPPDFSAVDTVMPFPGQAALRQMTGYFDNENENHTIQKINFKHQFGANSFGEVQVFRTQSYVHFLFPWDGGVFRDDFEFADSTNSGIGFDYSNQINAQNLVSVGGETIFTKPSFYANIPTSTLFQTPLECGQSCAQLGLTSVFNPNMPQGYVAPLQRAQGFAPVGPLPLLPDSSSQVIDNLHRSNAWIKDEFRPNDKWTVVAGVRWDQEVYEFPNNIPELNLQYFVDPVTGNFVDVPGPTIGKNVSQPSQVSPRIAVSFQANPRDIFRASYGRNIEFVPMVDIESRWNIPASSRNCTIANGCFTPLPGFSPTCFNGVDPANANAACNGISNLYQQTQEDLNTHAVAQFSPVQPQTATNADFSWTHEFNGNVELRVTPYYRKGQNYVVGNTPILFTLPGGTPVFGTTRNSNAGINQSTGVELAVSRQLPIGLSSLISATYDNTLANYDSDFFPTVNEAALLAGHLFHVDYIPFVQATANFDYVSRTGWKVIADFPFESGYLYGVGTKTFVFGPNGTTPEYVLNTDLAQNQIGNDPAASAYYFTDPTNPGTIEHPNIVASRGTAEGPDPGSLRAPAILTLNLTVAHTLGNGEVGIFANNLLGNYTAPFPFSVTNYVPQGMGGYGPGSGLANPFLKATEPYQFDLNPTSYITYPTGSARFYTFYYTLKI
ncbi:MAG TPA: TonB-dependent receptor [Candidatus Binatus sp.]|nr:TonB-dependent receptor [Candidatus Binatus sp.]